MICNSLQSANAFLIFFCWKNETSCFLRNALNATSIPIKCLLCLLIWESGVGGKYWNFSFSHEAISIDIKLTWGQILLQLEERNNSSNHVNMCKNVFGFWVGPDLSFSFVPSRGVCWINKCFWENSFQQYSSVNMRRRKHWMCCIKMWVGWVQESAKTLFFRGLSQLASSSTKLNVCMIVSDAF